MGFWDALKEQANQIPLTYLGGHPDLQGPVNVGVAAKEDAICLYRGTNPVVKISKADIINVSLDKASKRSLGKAAAGAIVGGVLTGGLGLLAGAALGGRKKDDSVIVITIKYGLATVDVLLGGDNVSKKYGQFVALLK